MATTITNPSIPQPAAVERTARPGYGATVLMCVPGLKVVVEFAVGVEVLLGEEELEEAPQTGAKFRPPLGAQ